MKIIKQLHILFLLILPSLIWAQASIPVLNAPVMDTAQMISPHRRTTLNQKLLSYAQQSGSQIVILTVPEVSPETPFDYGTRVFDQWQLGRSGIDDGVLLLLVRDERKMQMLVGRGLEGAIPDAYSKRLLDELSDYMRTGRVDDGLDNITARLQGLIEGESLPDASNTQHNQDSSFEMLLLLTFFVAPLISRLLRPLIGSLFSAAGISAGIGVVSVIAGLSAFSIIFLILMAFMMSFQSVSSILSSGMGQISTRGGGFGGGGFGGGGGRFGGGGASGSW